MCCDGKLLLRTGGREMGDCDGVVRGHGREKMIFEILVEVRFEPVTVFLMLRGPTTCVFRTEWKVSILERVPSGRLFCMWGVRMLECSTVVDR